MAHIDVRDGVAICVIGQDGREFKVGKVNGGQVESFDTYGGAIIALNDLKESVSKIAAEDAKGTHDVQQHALRNALHSHHLPGIWKVEKASVDGKAQPVRDDDPHYLVIRGDKTFRIVKKGRKSAGTWNLSSEGQFVMNIANDETTTAKMYRERDKLELTMNEDDRVVTLQYGRTNLTTEPKAIDE